MKTLRLIYLIVHFTVEINLVMKLKIFSDRQYLLDGMEPDPMFYLFWPHQVENIQYPWLRTYDNYINIGSSFFEMVSLKDADFAIIPANWRTIRGDSWRAKINKQAVALAIQFAQKVEQAGKPVVVFFSGDCSDEEIPLKKAIVFRNAIYCSLRKPNDFSMPPFVEDLVEHYLGGKLTIRQKCKKPVIGFCGLVKENSWKTRLKTLIYQGIMLGKHGRLKVPPYEGHILRSKALKILENSSLVVTNFIRENSLVFLIEGQLDERLEVRCKFVKNMAKSDYILCCRGSTNCSIRLFETLCCGRIPVFINTDCVLPYDWLIDWKKYCVWIDEKELPMIAEKVAEFHNNLLPQEFVQLQYECRQLWKEWLSAEGFFANLYRHFQLNTQEYAI